MYNINMEYNLDKSFDEEHWKDIKGFPDYLISDKGRVKALKFGKERILKKQTDQYGNIQVYLCNEGKRHPKKVHRLVLEAFSENPTQILDAGEAI